MTEATWFFLGVAGLALWSAVVAVSEIKLPAIASGHDSEPVLNNGAVNWRRRRGVAFSRVQDPFG